MGYFKFRRRIKILPGVHWNIGKKGSSVSLGGRGFTYTIGSKRSRTTIGIPGRGISYSHVQPHTPSVTPQQTQPPPVPGPSPNRTTKRPSRVLYVLGSILLIIWALNKLSDLTTAKSPSNSSSPNLISPAQRDSLSDKPAADAGTKQNSVKHDEEKQRQTEIALNSTSTYPARPTDSNTSPTIRRAVPVEVSPAPTRLEATATPAPTLLPTTSVYAAAPLQMPAPSPLITPDSRYRVVNVRRGDFLYLRGGPGSNYRAIVRLHPGTRGIALGSSRAANGSTIWQEISVGGYKGWVNEIYLEPEDSTR